MAVRLGIVGRGRWGRNIERTLLSFRDVDLVVIPREQHCRNDLDGVLIASPSVTHAELALPYIVSGLPTFIEKPMATTVADAERICDAANRSGAPVFVGHVHLYNPAFLSMLDILPTLGNVRCILCEGANNNPRADSSLLSDWLPHDLSMASLIFNVAPETASAWQLFGEPEPQAAVSRVQYGSTPLISNMSWISPARRQQLTVVADGGAIIFDDKAPRKLALHRTGEDVSYPTYDDAMPLAQELTAFLDLVRSGTGDPSHLELGLLVARAIAAAEESLCCGGELVRFLPERHPK
jgi:predicted dehydrogenase